MIAWLMWSTFAQSGDVSTWGILTWNILTWDIFSWSVLPLIQDDLTVDEEVPQWHSLFPEVVEPAVVEELDIQEIWEWDNWVEINDINPEPLVLKDKPKAPSTFLLDHEIVPLVLEPIETEEVELCEDGEEIQEEWIKCDDNNWYTEDDQIQEDWCTCKWDVPPIEIVESVFDIEYSQEWLPLLSSVESYDVTWWWAPRCSMIARLNLKKFYPNKPFTTTIQWPNSIVIWDAVTLIEQWKESWILSLVESRDIESALDNSNEFAHDIFIHSPSGYSIDSPRYYLQWHRAVVFQASDLQWYVIDPLRWKANTEPQILREYLYHYTNKDGLFYMYTSTLSGERNILEESTVLGVCNISLSEQEEWSLLLQSNAEWQFCFDIQHLCRDEEVK